MATTLASSIPLAKNLVSVYSGDNLIGLDNGGAAHPLTPQTQIGILAQDGVTVTALAPSPSTGIMGYIKNGNDAGVVNANGTTPNVEVPGGSGNGLVYNGGINTGTFGGTILVPPVVPVIHDSTTSHATNGIDDTTGTVVPVSAGNQVGETAYPVKANNPVIVRTLFVAATGLEAFIANGQQIGTVNAQGVVVAAVMVLWCPMGHQLQRMVHRLDSSVFGSMLSNRLSVGVTGDVSFCAKKTYTFMQDTNMFGSAPRGFHTSHLRPHDGHL